MDSYLCQLLPLTTIRAWRSRLLLILLFLFLCLCTLTSRAVQANDQLPITLKVKPDKCIALHKGQTCYQKVWFSWRLDSDQQYCLYEVSRKVPLVCWEGSERRSFLYRFESSESRQYQIVQSEERKLIAEVEIVLSWVYRSRRNSSRGWRLF